MKTKKAQSGLGIVKSFVLSLAVIIAVAIVGMVIAANLRDAGIFTAGDNESVATQNIVNNYSNGIQEFFTNVPTLFIILFVVVLVGLLAIVLALVSRFGGGGGSGL